MLEKLMLSQEFTVCVRLLLALLCGGILGLEREHKKRAAGFRTYMLVCVGATLVMLTNEYMAEEFSGIDPSRMGAQVISGIGFLGVGTIIVTRNSHVKGLTTAAGLWTTACVGLAIGAGYYPAALLGTGLIFLSFTMFYSLDKRIRRRSREFELYVEFEDIADVGGFIREIRKEKIRLRNIELINSRKIINDKGIAGMVSLGFNEKLSYEEVAERLGGLQGVLYIEEV